MRNFSKNKLSFLIILITIWQILSTFNDPIILPSPLKVSNEIFKLITSIYFLKLIGVTIMRTFLGAVFTLILGLLIGIGMGLNSKLEESLKSILIISQSTPIISWLLLALIWFDNRYIPIIVIIISNTPIIAINIDEGIKNVDNKLLEMAKIYKISSKKVLKEIYFPAIIPYLISSFKIILGLSYKVAVMSEVVAKVSGGIGESINWAWLNIETSVIIAWTVIIVFLTYISEKIIMSLINKKMEKYI